MKLRRVDPVWERDYDMLVELLYDLLWGDDPCYGEAAFLRLLTSDHFLWAGKGRYRNVFFYSKLPLVVKLPRYGHRRDASDSTSMTQMEFQVSASFVQADRAELIIPTVGMMELPDGELFSLQQVALQYKPGHTPGIQDINHMVREVDNLVDDLGGIRGRVWDTHPGNIVYDPDVGCRARDYSWDLGLHAHTRQMVITQEVIA